MGRSLKLGDLVYVIPPDEARSHWITMASRDLLPSRGLVVSKSWPDGWWNVHHITDHWGSGKKIRDFPREMLVVIKE